MAQSEASHRQNLRLWCVISLSAKLHSTYWKILQVGHSKIKGAVIVYGRGAVQIRGQEFECKEMEGATFQCKPLEVVR